MIKAEFEEHAHAPRALNQIQKGIVRDSLEVLLNESVNMLRDSTRNVVMRNGIAHPFSQETIRECVRVSTDMEREMNEILEALNITPRLDVFPGVFANIRAKGD